MVNAQELKDFLSAICCERYANIDQFQKERSILESNLPTDAEEANSSGKATWGDHQLGRLPAFIYKDAERTTRWLPRDDALEVPRSAHKGAIQPLLPTKSVDQSQSRWMTWWMVLNTRKDSTASSNISRAGVNITSTHWSKMKKLESKCDWCQMRAAPKQSRSNVSTRHRGRTVYRHLGWPNRSLSAKALRRSSVLEPAVLASGLVKCLG